MWNGRKGLHEFVEQHRAEIEEAKTRLDMQRQTEHQQEVDKESEDKQDRHVPTQVQTSVEKQKMKLKRKPTEEAVEPKSKVKAKPKIPFQEEKVLDPSGNPMQILKGNQRPPKKRELFEKTHRRFTNYLDNKSYSIIQDLRREGEIESMTSLLDNAVHEYLVRYFPNKV